MFVSSIQPTNTATDIRKKLTPQDAKSPKPVSGTLKNVHGEKPFLVKIQVAGFDGPSMLIYDRQRSFQATYLRSDSEDPQGFQRLADVVHKGIMGLKAYRWAKFVDGERLSVCVDVEPRDDVQW